MKKIVLTISIIMIATIGMVNASTFKGPINPPVANAVISGQVNDCSTGESLAGVAVTLEGSDLITYTDLDGNFKFKGILPGKYNLVFSYISYNKSLVENLQVTENATETIEVKLKETK
jgi:hypothetical protein